MNEAVPVADPMVSSGKSLSWLMIPSWLGSILCHLLLGVIVLFLSQLPACQRHRDRAGEGDSSFRETGIRLLPPGPPGGSSGASGESPATPEDGSNPLAVPGGMAGAVPAALSLPKLSPPVALTLPQVPQGAGLLGPASPSTFSGSSSGIGGLVRSSLPDGSGGDPGTGGGTGGGSGSGGGGGTSFMGVNGTGKKFVYVIDRSFSMASDQALQAAKMELLGSLQRLDETQQFQIIFYNNEYLVLNARGGRFDFFRGTDAQRLLVMEQIREITPAAGTRHLPAILEALNFKPDVVFLLTDGTADSALDRKDLEQVRRQNRNGTHIHCIEFGRGESSPLVAGGNFLKVLASENRGEYVYRNVKAGF